MRSVQNVKKLDHGTIAVMEDFRPLPPTFLASESSEMTEEPKLLYEAKLGYDFVKDKSGKYNCVEVNGQNAGVGLERADPQLVTEEEKAAVRELGETTVINPEWMRAITDDKAAQREVMGEYAPEQINEGSFAHLLNGHASEIVIKKRHSGMGNDVFIFNRSSLEDARRKMDAGDEKFAFLKDLKDDVIPKGCEYIVQKHLRAEGAEFADEDSAGNPAAMRFLAHVKVFEDGTFAFKDFAGFQRVSRFRYDQAGEGQVARVINNELVDLRRVGVVNSATGARTVPLSQLELEAGLTIARELTQRMIDIGRTKATYLSDAEESRQRTETIRTIEAARRAEIEKINREQARERALREKWDKDAVASLTLQSDISHRYKRRISFMPGHVNISEYIIARLPTNKFLQALSEQLKSLEKDPRGRSLLMGLVALVRYPYIYQIPNRSDESLGVVGEIKLAFRGKETRIPIYLHSERGLRDALEKFSKENAFFEPILGWSARRLLPPQE